MKFAKKTEKAKKAKKVGEADIFALKNYSNYTYIKANRLVYLGDDFKANMLVTMTSESHYCTCPGHLGWCDKRKK